MPSPTSTARPADSQQGGRAQRRRELTRSSLVRATMELLAKDQASLTVQAITERADVGVGSFYYHFPGKQEAIDAATDRAFQEVAQDFAARSPLLTDSADRFSTRVRLFIRASDSNPVAARILVKMFPEPWSRWEMTASTGAPAEDCPTTDTTAVQDLADAVSSGVLHTPRPEFSVLMVASGAVGLVARRLADPTIGPGAADDFTETALVMLGMESDAARELAHRPLPT
ncbi:MAG: TetR/AcrR family transcriptional regulator [Candidatus Nanopelagicales bacterium]